MIKSKQNTLVNVMKKISVVAFSTWLLSACSLIGLSDGSLDYQEHKKLPPLNLAGENANAIRPALNVPSVQQSSISFADEKNSRFVMPRANKTDSLATQNNTAKNDAFTTFNKALTENEKGVPILQVQAGIEDTKDKIIGILKANSYNVSAPKMVNHIVVSSASFKGNRLIRFSNVGTVTTAMVTKADSTLADANEARFILDTINKRW